MSAAMADISLKIAICRPCAQVVAVNIFPMNVVNNVIGVGVMATTLHDAKLRGQEEEKFFLGCGFHPYIGIPLKTRLSLPGRTMFGS